MKVVPLFPHCEPLPLETVHVGAVVGRTVCCRIPFGPLDRGQVNAIEGISIGLPAGFSLQPFDEFSENVMLLADGSVVFGVRVERLLPPGEYSVRVSLMLPEPSNGIIPPEQTLNCLVVHVYPVDFPGRTGGAKKSPAYCRASAADQN